MRRIWVHDVRRKTHNVWLINNIARLGYKQELRRNFTLIEIFGIAFSIMGLLPSIASTLAYSIPAGPVGLVWVRVLPKGQLRYSKVDRRLSGLVHRLRPHFCCGIGHSKA
jgi:hypothetical protein